MTFAAITFAACDGKVDDPDGDYKIDLDKYEITDVNPEGATRTIEVTATVDWTAEIISGNEAEWLEIDPTSGTTGENTITATAKANAGSKRTAVVRLKLTLMPSIYIDVKVTQLAGTTSGGDDVTLWGPTFSNYLGVTLNFTPFTGLERHELFIIDGNGDPVFSGEGNSEDKVLEAFGLESFGTYTFQYWGYNTDETYEGDDYFEAMKDVQKSNLHTVTFVMPAKGATLTAGNDKEGTYIELSDVQEGVQFYALFNGDQMYNALFMWAEEGQRQYLTESGTYTVKAVYYGHYSDPNAVLGPPSNAVTVTITPPAE